ncbi:MAG: papain-like cysteine peptidase [Methylobacterium radiotolerans]
MSEPGATGGLFGALGRLLGRRDAREPGRHNHVSLGCNCQMAHVLKTLDLRQWSGPLDWIFSMPGMARDCLADDFAALVDRGQLESIPEAERRGPGIWRGRHRLYRERHGLECVFNHHDPATSEADYAFLTEGVRRLRRALDTPGTDNRLWMMTHLHTPRDVVEAIDDLLGQRASRNHLTFVQLETGHPRMAVVEALDLRPTLRWLTVQTPSEPVGLRLADPADDAALVAIIRAEAARRPALFG